MDPLQKNNVRIINDDSALPTMLFVHGFGTDQRAWRFLQASFTERFRIVLLDLVGANEKTAQAYSVEQYSSLYDFADDIAAVCRVLALENVIIVGHSMGAMISLLAALKYPEYFSKVVMMTASPRYLNDDNYVGGFEQSDLDTLYAAMEQNYYAWVSGFAPYIMENPDKPSLGEEFAQSMSAVRPDIALSILRTVFQSDHRADVVRLTLPTLVLQSGRDAAVPQEVGLYLKQAIPHCRHITMNTTGHLPHISAPEEVIRPMLAFV